MTVESRKLRDYVYILQQLDIRHRDRRSCVEYVGDRRKVYSEQDSFRAERTRVGYDWEQTFETK